MRWFKRWRYERLIIARAKADTKLEQAQINLRKGLVCPTLAGEQIADRRQKCQDIEKKMRELQREIRYG